MPDGMKVRLKVEEGQILLRVASNFSLPERLGEDLKFNVADRSIATDEAKRLYRELKSLSPLLVSDRRVCFGPKDNWKCTKTEKGEESWAAKPGTDSVEVPVTLSEDARNGAYWVLLLCVHPMSPALLTAGSQEEIIWPLIKKLRFSKQIEKDLGLDKAQRKRVSYDPVDGEESEDEVEEQEAEAQEAKA